MELIRGLENGKASDIPIKLVKVSAPIITPILRKYYNMFMRSGEFPDNLKVGKITPIFKKGDQEKFENYRPVSTLPIFAKIFEKVIYSQLYDYLAKKNILYDNQYGFRKSHSCSHALNYSVSEIQKHHENDEHVIGIYIDLSKAFETIEHTKLLQKLNIYGIRGNVHALLKSYLSNRLQYTSALGENSSKLPIKYGVPQGSVLGPLLFLIYINDIAQCSNLGTFVLFADDTNVFVVGENIDEVHMKANSVLNSVFNYMTANQLHINMSKSCYMHFKPKRHEELGLELLFSEESLKIRDVPIKLINTTKFLGVVIDDELSWLPHIQKIRQKLNCQIGALSRILDNVPRKHHRELYFTLFESHISYCISVWGGVATKILAPILTVQKGCIRKIFGQEPFSERLMTCARSRPFNKQFLDSLFYEKEHTKPLFNSNHILTVNNLYVYHCFIELLKILKFRQPYPLFELFKLLLPQTRSTRFNSTYIHNHTPNNASKSSNIFTYRSAKIWNNYRTKLNILDFDISVYDVKNKLKCMLLSIQHAGVKTEWNEQNVCKY